jgi:hypothetical protein
LNTQEMTDYVSAVGEIMADERRVTNEKITVEVSHLRESLDNFELAGIVELEAITAGMRDFVRSTSKIMPGDNPLSVATPRTALLTKKKSPKRDADASSWWSTWLEGMACAK